MKTAELIRNDNVYRATGGKCWLATFEVVSDDGKVRSIKPMVRKVEVIGPNGSCSGLTVQAFSREYGPTGGELSASRDAVFDDRDDAQAAAVRLCESMDGQTVMGCFTYKYVRPKVRKEKAPALEVRVKQVSHDGYVVEYRDLRTRKWREVFGLGVLTRWKANDTAKRMKAGIDVPGYWLMPRADGVVEFIELCDYEV